MRRPIEIHNHPFRFLLYLEWILLAFAALSALIPSPVQRGHSAYTSFPELAIFTLTLFGLMGLRLPRGNNITKIIYTIIEVSLILSTGFFGGKSARLFPFLYVILVTRSCLIFQIQGRWIITILSFVLFILNLIQRYDRLPLSPALQERFLFFNFNFTIMFGLALVFVLLLMNTVLSERKSREELAIAHEKLRQYALRIESQATLEERNRIAREIHDSLGHSLTALNLQLETALKLWQSQPEKAQTFLARAKELGSKALQDVRQSVSTIRSYPLQEQNLEQAIAGLLENMQRITGVAPIYKIEVSDPLPPEISNPVYRIIQESFTNICKHAQATQVILELITKNRYLHLVIQDNGKGFDMEQNTTGFGLQSMRDRTLALGGKFKIKSLPDFGCKIIIDIPL